MRNLTLIVFGVLLLVVLVQSGHHKGGHGNGGKKKGNGGGNGNGGKKNDNDGGKKGDNDKDIDDEVIDDEDTDDEENDIPEKPECTTKCTSNCKFGFGQDESFTCPGKKGSKRKCCVPINHPCSVKGGTCMKRECSEHYEEVAKGKEICGSNTRVCCAPKKAKYARCIVEPASDKFDDQVTGSIYFKQAHGKNLEYIVKLEGFNTKDDKEIHGFHVHTLGDTTAGCASTTGHFNPDEFAPSSVDALARPAGDFANIKEDNKGRVGEHIIDSKAALSGEYSIIGRSIVVHSGIGGPRVACCTIGISTEAVWEAEAK